MRPRHLVVSLATGLLVLTGCGSGTTPADDVPALAAALDDVDEAIAAGEYDAARDAITELAEEAREARRDGDLEPSEADRITETAEALLAALPEGGEPQPEEQTEEEPAPEASTTSTPVEESTGDDSDEDSDEGSGPGPEPGGKPDKPDKPEKPGKPEKKDDDD